MPTPYFEFRVNLLGVRPMIWRRFRISADASFWDLHVAIQDVMEWDDLHLHCFRMVDRASRTEMTIGVPDPDGADMEPGWTLRIADHFDPQFHPIAIYEYDFGDGWLHEVVLEAWGETKQGSLPAIVGGERARPPENFGGPHLYQEFVDAWADPAHPDHDDAHARLGPHFDPEAFDAMDVEFEDPQERWREVTAGDDLEASDDAHSVESLLSLVVGDPTMAGIADVLGKDTVEDMARYLPLGRRFQAQREQLGLTIKEVAAELKDAQKRVKAVESAGGHGFDAKTLMKYARFLDLESAVAAWTKANPETAHRMGIVARGEG